MSTSVLLLLVLAASTHTYKVRSGDDPRKIAQKNRLHAAECGKAIMTGNAIADARSLEVGRELVIPYEIKHVVKAGESVSELARAYYKSPKLGARLIQECNGIGGDKLASGSVIYVPLFERPPAKDEAPRPEHKAPSEPKAAEPSAETEPPKTEPVPSSATEDTAEATPAPPPEEETPAKRVRAAVKGYQDGDYDEACRELQRLLVDPRLANDERATVIEHCGYCEIAYGNTGVARDYFRSWLALKPDATLNQITTSPKILDALDQARRDMRKPNGE